MEISLTVTGKTKQIGRYQQTQLTHPYKTTLKRPFCHLLNTRKEHNTGKQREETTATTKELHTYSWNNHSSHFPEMIQVSGSWPAQRTAAETEEYISCGNNRSIKDWKSFSWILKTNMENLTFCWWIEPIVEMLNIRNNNNYLLKWWPCSLTLVGWWTLMRWAVGHFCFALWPPSAMDA